MRRTLMAAESETLHDHIDEAMRYYDRLFLSNGYDRFLANRLKNLSMNLKNCGALVRLAILLHDSGKAHSKYQANLVKPGIPHEAYSAALAWNVLQLDEVERKVIASAILLHHEYMRLPDPNIITEDFEGYVEELRGVLKDLSSKYGVLQYLNLCKVTTLPSQCVKDVIKSLSENLKKDKRLYTCTVLVLHPLLICDNLSASLHRGGKSSRILEDIEDPEILSVARRYLKELLETAG